jgi:hypothetical protein
MTIPTSIDFFVIRLDYRRLVWFAGQKRDRGFTDCRNTSELDSGGA